MTSHSPVASVNLSAIRSSIGRTRTSVGFAGSGFFSGGLAIDVRPLQRSRAALCIAGRVSGVAVKDGRVHRLRRAGRIEVLAQERDLAPNCTQEYDVLLTVGPPGP